MPNNYNYSPILENNNLFVSLVDYRNNYFTSQNADKVVEFYNGFNNREQLIEWMSERPKGNCVIKEVGGDKDCTSSLNM